jgi:Transketolase, C-terminal subunit
MSSHGSRNKYLDEIIRAVENGEDLFLVTADLAAPCLDGFRRKFPQRYVSVGIAEQNLISVACGIALTGKKVIAYTSNPFPVLRAYDQIRNAVALMNLPLTIIGVGAGFSIPEYGATHFTIEDMNMLRICPNINIINISDDNLALEAANRTLHDKEPLYLRFDKMVDYELACPEQLDWNKGFRMVKSGDDFCIISTGSMIPQLIDVAIKIQQYGFQIALVDLFKLPFQEQELMDLLETKKKIITVEELCIQGGIGSVVLETMADYGCMKPVRRIGLDMSDGYPEKYGCREYHMKNYGMSNDILIENIMNFLKG